MAVDRPHGQSDCDLMEVQSKNRSYEMLVSNENDKLDSPSLNEEQLVEYEIAEDDTLIGIALKINVV